MPTANSEHAHARFPALLQTVSTPALDDTLAGKALLALSASLLVALCAHVSVRVPFTPVPFTLSDLAVVLVGLALGPATAFSALVLYLAEGASGLPVFAPGGLGGIAQLLGPTGGFLLCYPFAAALAGGLRQTFARVLARFPASLLAAAAASALLMSSGVLWLGVAYHLAPIAAFRLGALPFLPGQLVKIAAAAGIYSSLQRWRRA